MNAFFAAGLFDSPWVIAALVIGSALANWLAKRRQEKQARKETEGETSPPASGPPPGEFNLEETLRRLMGEEPPTPSPTPPPLIPHPARRDLPPVQTSTELKPLPPEWMRQPARTAAPVLPPPMTARATNLELEQAEQRFEQLTEQVRHPAKVVTHTRQRPGRSGTRGPSRWRDVRSVRRAFVASLIFAPPKSFEP